MPWAVGEQALGNQRARNHWQQRILKMAEFGEISSLYEQLPSSPRRGWRARDSGGPARPDVRKRVVCARVGWCQIWCKRSPKPTQRARLACLATPEMCIKWRASNTQLGEQPSQRKYSAHGWARGFNENKLDDNAIWPWSSGIAAGTAHEQLRLQQHTPILQVSYITRYVFSIHWYIDFTETYITCYIYYYTTNHNQVQNTLGRRFAAALLPRLFGTNPRSHHKGAIIWLHYCYLYVDNTYITLLYNMLCTMLYETWYKST